jgi:low temperature requirement protein LtrA
MTGRDPQEQHRSATPLELLFDLTFVVAFGVAAEQLAHGLAESHVIAAVTAFGYCVVAICWAWISFSWFSSAYDTDDWIYRLMTMLQMVGVVVLALGIPPVYSSLAHGGHLDIQVMVAGYVVMRTAVVAQWLRAARQDPNRRATCLTYAATVFVAQIGWVIMIFAHLSIGATFVCTAVLLALELLGPPIAEALTEGTPWHARHIAERYSLLTIIALGEGVVGTVASLSAVVSNQGWSADAVMVAVAGTGLTFGMWWIYFVVPLADLLDIHREQSSSFGYLHFGVFGSIVATGAGLYTAALYIEHHSHLGPVGTVLSVALPVAVYIATINVLYSILVRTWHWFHALVATATAAVLAAAVAMAASGVPMAACLLVIMLAPAVGVVGFEWIGHRHVARAIDKRIGADR